MSYSEALQQLGYQWESELNSFKRNGFGGIGYSDGDEVEHSVYEAVKNSKDVSILSPEMLGHNQTWPLRYHLNPKRSNLLRPIQHHFKGNVLEIGAGCGAITRFLGECTSAEILALEGSPLRAKIAAERTRDLKNVTVIVEDIWTFPKEFKFDVITLIGVFEYSPVYSERTDPFSQMLDHVKSLLKPNGLLIIAIENKLGLKYLAGSPEDHHGKPNYGIEGRYRERDATTLGHPELVKLLNRHGFADVETYAPLPDYKLVNSVISEVGMNHNDFSPGALVSASVQNDNNFAASPYFDVSRVFNEFHKNGLGMTVANSFLILASQSHIHEQSKLAWHYSVERKKEFAKETVFTDKNGVSVSSKRLIGNGHESEIHIGPVTQHIEREVPYVSGKPLIEDFHDVVSVDNWELADLVSAFKNYLDVLFDLVYEETGQHPKREIHLQIPSNFIDALPQNLIRTEDGTIVFIDREWSYEINLELGFILYRAIFSFLDSAPRISTEESRPLMTRNELVTVLFESLNFSVNSKYLDYLEAEEWKWQSQVRGQILERWSQGGNELVAHAITPEMVAAQIERVFRNSRSWKLTAPYRKLVQLIRGWKLTWHTSS